MGLRRDPATGWVPTLPANSAFDSLGSHGTDNTEYPNGNDLLQGSGNGATIFECGSRRRDIEDGTNRSGWDRTLDGTLG